MNPSNVKYKNNMANTRRKYMGGVPGSKIVRFTMGNTGREFSHRVELVNIREVQIRHNALESARIAANRLLELHLGRDNYMLKIVTYPHHIIREHKRVNVAQADRFQEGMKKAYGKPAAVAARVKSRQSIMIAEVEKRDVNLAKEALKRASDKFPSSTRIVANPIQ